MKAIKALVIGMSLLIAMGLALVGYGLYRNAHPVSSGVSSASRNAASPPSSATDDSGFFKVDVPVPAGTHLTEVLTAGDRVILHFDGPDGDRLVIMDPHSGHITGSVSMLP
jgi:hypothetical protein